MPSGCEFTCKNKNCKGYNTGFVITAPWPMSKINSVINSSSLKFLETFRGHLSNLKDEGKKYACIQFPNVDNIPVQAYRIQLWSDDAKCIWEYEIKIDENDDVENIDFAKHPSLPELCPKTKCKLKNYFEVVKSGIQCPLCNILLVQNRWFTKEI